MRPPFSRTPDPKLARLASHRLFAGLDQEQLARVAPHVDEVTIPQGTTFIRQGQAAFEMVALRTGSVGVVADGQHVATLSDGDVVGEIGVLDHRPRTADVVALTDIDVFVVDRRSLPSMLQDLPALAARVRGLADLRGAA